MEAGRDGRKEVERREGSREVKTQLGRQTVGTLPADQKGLP